MNIERVTFRSACLLEPIDGTKDWLLHGNFAVTVHFEPEDGGAPVDEWIVVPDGFVTDLSSVPRLPLAYLLLGGRGRKAGVLHDYLYSRGRDREFADAVFYAALRQEKTNKWQRGVMWAGVRLFGWPFHKSPKVAP